MTISVDESRSAYALRVIARHDPDLMRAILALALESFESNRKSYHLSCDPARIPTELYRIIADHFVRHLAPFAPYAQ